MRLRARALVLGVCALVLASVNATEACPVGRESGAADRGSCSWTEPLVALQERIRTTPRALERLSLYEQKEVLQLQLAQTTFNDYLQGRLNERFAPECLAPLEDSGSFLYLAQSAFIEKSLEALRASKLRRVQRLVRTLGLERGANSTSTLAFRLTGEGFSEAPTELKAGFHRATKSIFMDVSRTPPGEWFVILIHELIHRADAMIPAAVERYSEIAIAQRLIEAAQLTSKPEDLSPEQGKAFKDWIQFGMDRGLLAEARAWAITILIYQDGLRAGQWEPIAWLDEVLRERARGESTERFALRFLSARSKQSDEGAFQHELARRLLEEVKRELLDGTRPFEFGALSPLLDL